MREWALPVSSFLTDMGSLVEPEALHHLFRLGGVGLCLVLRVAYAEDAGGRIAKKALDIDDLVTRNTGDLEPVLFL